MIGERAYGALELGGPVPSLACPGGPSFLVVYLIAVVVVSVILDRNPVLAFPQLRPPQSCTCGNIW
jgi:hypothetical protein